MKIKVLDQKHGSYDAQYWAELRALVKGGKRFKALLSVFLPKNPVEAEGIYSQRVANAHYTSHIGSIVSLYSSWLFAANFSMKAHKRDTDEVIAAPDKFYGQLQENVGNETTLTAFMQDRFSDCLTHRRAYWLAELPSNNGVIPETAQEYEARDLGRARLRAVDIEELYDWEEDDNGELLWCLIHRVNSVRTSPVMMRDQVQETWHIYDRENVTVFEKVFTKGTPRNPEEELVPRSPPSPHGFKRVPLVCLHLKEEICPTTQTADAQVEHFRRENALSWLIKRTCYAQPVFNLEDGDRPPTMGAGYAIVLGQDDKMGWTSPPTAPFDVLQKAVEAKRDDIYRLTHQMAQAVDNNAETVGRSADSKEIDAAATRILLNAYGKEVSKAIEETLEIISAARSESDYEWSVEGFSGYDTATAASLLSAIEKARLLGIPSPTFHKEITTKAAMSLLPEADQRIKDSIRSEIDTAKFDVSSQPVAEAKSVLDLAKADAAPIVAGASKTTADASMKTASRPPPKPSANGAAGPPK